VLCACAAGVVSEAAGGVQELTAGAEAGLASAVYMPLCNHCMQQLRTILRCGINDAR
jgi:hypothetical protein